MIKTKLTVRDMCLIGVFAALTAVMAQISIPMPMGVPITMQTFAISLMGVLLGSRRGFVAALIYILLGAVGIPVFSSFRGGIDIVFGPRGGFILSYPFMAWLIGFGAEKAPSKAYLAAGLICGTLINYILGTTVYCAVTGSSLSAAFAACVAPFIPADIVKAVAAGALGAKIKARGILQA